MSSFTETQKKKKKNLLLKKRINLKKNINLDNNFFYEILNQHQWFNESKVIASFLSIKSEIPTNSVNKFIEDSDKILCLPVIKENYKNGLIFKLYKNGDQLNKGRFNVDEPANSKTCLPDVIFTPCLGYDNFGFRLGYGGGYYDKTISYLHSINHKFLSVALAYDDQKVDNIVHDNFDQKLNYILTEKQLYKIL